MQPFAKTCNRCAMFFVILFLLPAGLVLLSGFSFPRRLAAAVPRGQSVLSGDAATPDQGPRPGHALLSHEPLSDQEADTVIRVAVSDTFSIALPASFGEGFSWQLKDSSFSRKVRYLWQDHHPSGASMPGSRDIQVLYFKALAPGSAPIRLIYVQPFKHPYKAHAPQKTVTIIIHSR